MNEVIKWQSFEIVQDFFLSEEECKNRSCERYEMIVIGRVITQHEFAFNIYMSHSSDDTNEVRRRWVIFKLCEHLQCHPTTSFFLHAF